MGTSVPAEPRWTDDAPPAEKLLWRWAVEQLPDRVLVLPQVAMTLREGGRVDGAEADLVLVDPEAGITAIEVKGGTISYDGDRAVWRRQEAGSKAIRDPVQQAQRAQKHLRRAVARAAGDLDPETIAWRWAVATPDCRLDAPGAPVLDAAQLWDAGVLDDLEQRYARLVGELSLGETPIGADRADYLARHLRGRSVEGRPALSTEVEAHEAAVAVHTESHRNVLRQFTTNPYVLVRGAAGTGKTVLALEAATQLASMGSRVLLTCWNVVLGEWLREALRAELRRIGSPAADEVTADPTGKVVVSHVVGLTHGAQDRPELAAEDRDTQSAYYHDELPEVLDPRLTGGEFDAIILDEAQDLSDNWIVAVSSLLSRQGRWYAFSDRQQDLFHNDAALPDFLEIHHELRENFRNSRQIAAFAAGFGEIEMDCVTGDGPPIRYVAAPHDRVIARAGEVAKKLMRDEKLAASDLAVLWLFHNPYRGRTDELAAEAMRGELVHTNAASFKGMERPVVVLGLDIDPAKTDRVEEARRSIYAGATRARSHLVVVGDPEVCRACGFDELADSLAADTVEPRSA